MLWHIMLLLIYHAVILRCAFLAELFSVKEMSSWNSDNPKLNLNQAHESKYKTNSKMWSEFAYVSFICKIKFWQEMENKKIILRRILITSKFEYFYLFFFILSSLRINTIHQDGASYAGNLRVRK